jgi:type I restriction enzyme S subunit
VIEDKHRAYRRYVASGLVAAADLFVVAVNGARIPNADIAFPDEVPYPIQAVLPLGAPSVTIDCATGEVVRQGFAHRPRIMRRSGVEIGTRVFLEPDYAGISALLFSTVHPLRNADSSVDALSLLHNPVAEASRMLPRGWLTRGIEWWVENDELHHRRLGSCA